MIVFVPLAALLAVSYLYREDLGVRALVIYFLLWVIGVVVMFAFQLSPGIFTAWECSLVIAMLIQVRANPKL